MVVVTSFLMGTCGGKLTRSSVVVDGNFVQIAAALPAVIKNKFLRELQLLSVVWLLNNNLGHTTTTPIFCKFLNLPSIHVARLIFSFVTSSHFPLNKKEKRNKQQKTGIKKKTPKASASQSTSPLCVCLFVRLSKEICQYDKPGGGGGGGESKNQMKNTIAKKKWNTCGKTSGEDHETHENKNINSSSSSSSSDNTHEAPSPQVLSLSNNQTLCPLNANPNFDHR